MKKILVAMAAICISLLATAAELLPGTSGFEDLDVGARLDPTAYVEGVGKSFFWFMPGYTEEKDTGVVTNYPAAGEHGSKYLAIETGSDTLYRTITWNNKDENFTAVEVENGVDIAFDTMVQFTASDADVAVSEGDKIAVWLKSVDAEPESGETPAVEGSTNLIVTAGYLTGEGNAAERKDYVISGTAIEPGSWHRLTVQARQMGQFLAFQVLIDGNAVSSEEAKGAPLSAAANYGATFFPSMVGQGLVGAKTLSAVAFKGTGAIDDVSFSSVALSTTYTIVGYNSETMGTLSVMVDGQPVELDNFTFTVPAVAQPVVDVAAKAGYCKPTVVLEGTTYTISVAPAAVMIGETAYASFNDALSAVTGGETLKLVNNVDLGAEGTVVAKPITIDLAGKKMTSSMVTLTADCAGVAVIDSVGGGSVETTGETADEPYALFGGDNSIIVGANGAANNFTIVGRTCSILVWGGKFSQMPEADSWEILAEGKEWSAEPVEGYYVLVDGTPDARKPLSELTIELSAASADYNGANVAPTVTVTDQTAVADTEYTVTFMKGDAPVDAIVDAGEYAIVIAAAANSTLYKGSVTKVFTVNAVPGTATITFEPDAVEAVWSADGALPSVSVVGNATTGAWDKTYPAENPAEDVVFTYTVTFSGNYTGTVSKTFTVKSSAPPTATFPSDWNGGAAVDDAVAAKFAAWAAANGKTVDSVVAADELAFLMNVAPAADLSLNATSITVAGGQVTLTSNAASAPNGVLWVKYGPTPGNLSGISQSLKMTASDAQQFFRICIGYAAPAEQAPTVAP